MKNNLLSPNYIVNILNIIHLLIGGICSFGSLFVVNSLLPLVIILSMGVLSRFHDYCWLTKITQAIESIHNKCKEQDIYPHAPFFNHIIDEFDTIINDKIIRNIIALLIGINVCIALYRMSIYYKFKIIPNQLYKYIIIICILIWLLSEIYIYNIYNYKPICDETCQLNDNDIIMFTPINEIQLNEI